MQLSEETKRVLERKIGLPYAQIIAMSPSESDAHVEKVTGRKLTFSKEFDPRRTAPGNPLLSRKRFTTKEERDNRIV